MKVMPVQLLVSYINKVVVVANSNSNNTIIPEWNDEDDIINQNVDANKYYESTRDISGKNYTLLNAFFKSKNNWDWNKPYLFEINKPIEPIEEVTPDNAASNGSYWQKAAYYETANEPSSLNWKTYFTISDYGLMGWKTTDGVQLSLKID